MCVFLLSRYSPPHIEGQVRVRRWDLKWECRRAPNSRWTTRAGGCLVGIRLNSRKLELAPRADTRSSVHFRDFKQLQCQLTFKSHYEGVLRQDWEVFVFSTIRPFL
jgi:hypothetical protein